MSSKSQTKSRPTIHSESCDIINKVTQLFKQEMLIQIRNFQLKIQQNMPIQQEENQKELPVFAK
jgi:glycine cleavage system regulatory protein